MAEFSQLIELVSGTLVYDGLEFAISFEKASKTFVTLSFCKLISYSSVENFNILFLVIWMENTSDSLLLLRL